MVAGRAKRRPRIPTASMSLVRIDVACAKWLLEEIKALGFRACLDNNARLFLAKCDRRGASSDRARSSDKS
jgi:hypothetical protein